MSCILISQYTHVLFVVQITLQALAEMYTSLLNCRASAVAAKLRGGPHASSYSSSSASTNPLTGGAVLGANIVASASAGPLPGPPAAAAVSAIALQTITTANVNSNAAAATAPAPAPLQKKTGEEKKQEFAEVRQLY